jgi:hypothetical protein
MVMKKSGSVGLAALALGCLLILGAAPAAAYYPPLLATGSGGGSEVSFSVAYPWGGGVSTSASYPPGVTVSNFTQHHGVMAWIVQDGANFSVGSCTFDPFLNTFVQGSQGYYSGVSQLQVNDGVVAFLAGLPPNITVIGYTTYAPDKGAWISGQTERTNLAGFQYFLVKDGVVAWVAEQDGGTLVQHTIRDPRAGSWEGDGTWYAAPGGVDYFAVTNATVYWDRASIHWYMGYKAVKNPTGSYYGGWYAFEATTPLAYFIAQPLLGLAPLRVWFTDLSIAAGSWTWQFGDGAGSTARSPYHTFNSSGSFPVTQQISGPNGSDTYSRTIILGSASQACLPAILQLLMD